MLAARYPTGLLLLGLWAIGCSAAGGSRTKTSTVQVDARRADRVRSNIERKDYVGSRVCENCHSEIYKEWLTSPMHEMTRLPATASIRAPFDGRVFRFKGDQ